MPQAPSTRWCPTPEQLMMLEEMYRGGIRTPNASQIQQIAAHLSYYGKIENKNVFYWFQNHKARERQKMRKRLSRHQQLLFQHQHHQQSSQQHQPQLLRFQKTFPADAAAPLPPCYAQVLQMELPHPSQAYANFQPPPPQFLPQGLYPEATTSMVNLMCKVDSCGKEKEGEGPMPTAGVMGCRNEWMVMVDVGSTLPPPASCRPPLKTLDLFPTKSTGDLREECSTSKSSSSSCLN